MESAGYAGSARIGRIYRIGNQPHARPSHEQSVCHRRATDLMMTLKVEMGDQTLREGIAQREVTST